MSDPNVYPQADPAHLLPEHATETGSARRGPLRLILVVLFLLIVIALIVWRIHNSSVAQQQENNKAAAAANRPTPVQVTQVQQKTVPVFVTALGTVTAYNTVTINSRVSGQLLQVNFREGQAVHKGQLLMQIDPRPYQAAVDQAVGQLAKDEANLKNTQAEAQRYTALYEAGVVSKESQQLQVSNQGQAAGTIKADQAAIESAKVNLAYTRISSPIDGVVGLRQVDPGNIVNSGSTTALVVITQIHPISVIFTLPEDQLPQVQRAMRSAGKPLVLEAYDRTDAHMIASGTLLTIDNQIDTTTGTAKLKAVFENADGSLFANQFVNVRLILSERENAVVVPTAAISSGTQGDFVFVVNNGPTPANKRKNMPSTVDASGKPAGGQTAGSKQKSADGGGGDGKPRQQFHADQVNVHVDFTIGTNSILADGAVHQGQQVVVDGQEKLVDGGNVSPAQSRAPKPATTGQAGAAGANGASGQSPVPSSNNGGGTHAGAQPGNRTGTRPGAQQ